MANSKIIKNCVKCQQLNYIDWWWHDESEDRWVCYGCGMNRSKEYVEDQIPMRRFYETAPTTQTPLS
jgi:hypothetical protein